MNAAPDSIEPPVAAVGWNRKKFIWLLLLAIIVHLALTVIFGAKHPPTPRRLTDQPQLGLVSGPLDLIALTDPTLFAVPHEQLDGTPSAWLASPSVQEPSFHWTETAPSFLIPQADELGKALGVYLQSNQVAMLRPDFKPAPPLIQPEIKTISALPRSSTLVITDGLMGRPTVNLPAVPDIVCNDVIRPNRVQVVVDPGGNVVSAVLLESSDYDPADRKALALAKLVRFAPAQTVATGVLLFTWHTVSEAQP